MSLSSILAVTQMTQSQSNKDVTVNDHLSALEKRAGFLSKSVAGGAGTTNLTPAEARYGVLEATGVLTGNRVLNVPTGFDHSLVILNSTTGAFSLSLQFNGGASVAIPKGSAVSVRNNAGAAAYDYRGGSIKLPEVIANRATSTQSLTLNAATVLAFNAEDLDSSSSFDTSTFAFTAPATGLYKIDAIAEVDVSGVVAGNYNGHVAIRVGGTVVRRGEVSNTGAATTGTTLRHSVSGLIQLTAGAVVDIVFTNTQTGGTLDLDFGIEKTRFELFCLRLGS